VFDFTVQHFQMSEMRISTAQKLVGLYILQKQVLC